MKNDVKQIHAEINAAMREIAQKYGLTLQAGTLRYSDTELSMQVRMSKLIEQSADEFSLSAGLARPGTKAWVREGSGWIQVSILKARNTRYLIELPTGVQATIPFRGCKAERPA